MCIEPALPFATRLTELYPGRGLPMLALLILSLSQTFPHVLGTERVTSDKIAGAICVYLQISAAWLVAYLFAFDVIGPDAFAFANGVPAEGYVGRELYYFSWVTMTTLGYGDITPTHPFVRVLANMECVAGQFYIAIVVARLVALQITQARA